MSDEVEDVDVATAHNSARGSRTGRDGDAEGVNPEYEATNPTAAQPVGGGIDFGLNGGSFDSSKTAGADSARSSAAESSPRAEDPTSSRASDPTSADAVAADKKFDPFNPDIAVKDDDDASSASKTNAPPPVLAKAIEPPKLENWDDKSSELRELPQPIKKELVLPEYVPPKDDDFGQKTGGSGGFTKYAYLIALVFFVVALYTLVAGFVILGYRYPMGISAFLCFFIAFLFLVGGVVQLVGFLNHPNKPIMHMFYTIVVNFIIFSVFLVAILQIFMEKNLFDYAKETFKLRFARYAYRFIKEDIDKVFNSTALANSLFIITVIAATACVFLAMVQCCYYVPVSFWTLICCLILPICVIILGITVGVLFLCLSFMATPFSHTNKSDFTKYEDDSPAGGYLSKTGMVLLFVAAGLVVYIVVAAIVAKCCYNRDQKKKTEKGLGWPNSDDVTYEYFRKNDFVLPFNAYARNSLGIILGISSVAVVVVVLVMIPNTKYQEKDAEVFFVEACPSSAMMGHELSTSPLLSPSSVVLSLPSSSFVDPAEADGREGRGEHNRTYTLAFQERDPCGDAEDSLKKFLEVYDPTNSIDMQKNLTLQLVNMTEATRKLVQLTSILVVVPLFPVVVAAVLLLALLLSAICCLSAVSVCICGPNDTREKIEKDMQEWQMDVQKKEIKREQDHTTLRNAQHNIEDRVAKFNKKLEDMGKKREGIESKINTWKNDADNYQKHTELQSGVKFDKLQKDRENLAKQVKKFNKELEDFI